MVQRLFPEPIGADYLLEKPGQAIPTEGVHDLSVNSMNTSFFLMSHKDRTGSHCKQAINHFLTHKSILFFMCPEGIMTC